jgi:hypothetical protein
VRFSIRDLLWATLMMALCLGWWLDRRAEPSRVACGVLRDSNAVDSEVIDAIEFLRATDAKQRPDSDFWLAIATDERFSDGHRARCFMEFFRQHVPPGTRLVDLLAARDANKWFNRHSVYLAMSGRVPRPFSVMDDGAIYCVQPNFMNRVHCAVLFSVKEELTHDGTFVLIDNDQLDPQIKITKVSIGDEGLKERR